MFWTDYDHLRGSVDDLRPAVIVFLAVNYAGSCNEIVLGQSSHDVPAFFANSTNKLNEPTLCFLSLVSPFTPF
jgi:hypothetical protein